MAKSSKIFKKHYRAFHSFPARTAETYLSEIRNENNNYTEIVFLLDEYYVLLLLLYLTCYYLLLRLRKKPAINFVPNL